MGRFINGDTLTSTGQGLLGNNMFAYCGNNPVNRTDVSGADSLQFENDEDTVDLDETAPSGCGPCGGQSQQGSVNTKGTGTANTCLRVGGGHGNPVHSERIDNFMDGLVESGDYQVVYGNRALSTAGLEGSQRPDIIAVHNDGTYEIWEFASPSQAIGTRGYAALDAKIQVMRAANPSARFNHIVPW